MAENGYNNLKKRINESENTLKWMVRVQIVQIIFTWLISFMTLGVVIWGVGVAFNKW